MPSKKDVLLTVFFSVESRKSSLAEGESKNGDAISPVISTNDGKSSRDGKPDQSESANGVEAQLGGSRAGCIKKVDPYEGTGAIPKRRNQPKASSSSNDTSAEETDESKEKTDDFSKDKILPSAVQGGPDNNVDLYCETHGITNMNHCLGLVLGSYGL